MNTLEWKRDGFGYYWAGSYVIGKDAKRSGHWAVINIDTSTNLGSFRTLRDAKRAAEVGEVVGCDNAKLDGRNLTYCKSVIGHGGKHNH